MSQRPRYFVRNIPCVCVLRSYHSYTFLRILFSNTLSPCSSLTRDNKVTHKYKKTGIIIAGDKIEKNELSGSCSTYGGGESRVQGFGGETWGKEATGETKA